MPNRAPVAVVCRVVVRSSLQALWRLSRPVADQANCHGKEGVAGSSPAEGLGNRVAARFSCFRSGSDDHFRALPSEKGSSVAADGRCAAVCATASRFCSRLKVPRRYTAGAESLSRPPRVSESFDADQPGPSWRAGRSGASVVMNGGLGVLGASGPRAIAIAAPALAPRQTSQTCCCHGGTSRVQTAPIRARSSVAALSGGDPGAALFRGMKIVFGELLSGPGRTVA